MEIENGFFIAASGDFYYQGTAEASAYASVNTERNFDNSDEVCIGTRTFGRILYAVQIVLMILTVLCIFKGISNIKKNKLIKNAEEQEELSDGVVYLNNDENIRKKSTLGYFIFSGVLCFITYTINVIKNFAAKPIIYIYPEEEMEIKVKLKNPEKLTCSYPRYEDEWNVFAKPNGELIDIKQNRKLYALYWEGLNTTKSNLKSGFIVEGDNVAKFLEEKLEILGLNEREAEEFIVYWLPLMEKNKYNYIRFETKEEIEENMGLEITPAPETLIRINMEFKGLRKPLRVEEQKLEKVTRKGYTVVEWGGTKL